MDARLRVLIVGESEAEAATLIRELESAAYNVQRHRIDRAQELEEALNQQAWDAVIADYHLPDSTPLQVLATVKRRDADLPLVFVADTVSNQDAASALKLGAQDCIARSQLARLLPAIERGLRTVSERRIRREAEAALRRSEERYRELVENANDVVFTNDLAGNFTSLNKAGEQISGYSRKQLQRMNMREVLTPESYALALEMIQRKLTDSRPTIYQIEMVARDGHHIGMEISTRLIYHGEKPVGVQGIARDITERKRAAEALEARERQQAAVAELGQQALATTNLEELFADAACCLTQTLQVDFASVLELSEDGKELVMRAGEGWPQSLVGQSVGTGPRSQAGYTLLSDEPVIAEDLAVERRFEVPEVLAKNDVASGISVVIPGPVRAFGTLNAFSRQHRAFGQDDVHFLRSVANVLATAVERTRLEEERAEHNKILAARVLQAYEEERKRVARELHDETAQALSVLLANLDLLEPHVRDQDEVLKSGFDRVAVLARRALDETRALSHDLRPTILDDAGLVAALQWVAGEHEKAYGEKVKLRAQREPARLAPEVELALFRIAQEGLTNSGKHAQASQVRVSLSFRDSTAKLVIEDDGMGFDLNRVVGPTHEGRLGLYGMQERAALIGGKLDIRASPGEGTRVSAEIPLQVEESEERESPKQPKARMA